MYGGYDREPSQENVINIVTRLVVHASMGTTSAWDVLVPGFHRLSGYELLVSRQSSATFEDTLASDAPADLIVMYTGAMNDVIRHGKVLADSSTIFARRRWHFRQFMALSTKLDAAHALIQFVTSPAAMPLIHDEMMETATANAL